jgi:hypothetical protein
MGTNVKIHYGQNGKLPFSTVRRTNRTPFVVKWRAFQHEVAFKLSRLDCFSTGISEIVAMPCRTPLTDGDVSSPFRKSLLNGSIVS